MAKNIVICLDGTSNEFGRSNTNVVRLFQCLEASGQDQVGYYDPGVGTIAEPGRFSQFGKKWSRMLGLGFGRGLVLNIEEAYSFLMEHYQDGDRIYIFGFSRGAYTARALAGLLHQLGVLNRGSTNLVPYATKLFQALEVAGPADDPASYWKICNSFKSTFAQARKRCPVHFLGLWDTVASVGWVWNPKSFPYVTHNPGVGIVRHALAIDERRWFFRHSLWGRHKLAKNQDIRECWFRGVHSDVGGGYREEEGQLWRAPFVWILAAAKKAGLRLDARRVQAAVHGAKPFAANSVSARHESLAGPWHLAELFPKLQWSPKRQRRFPAMGLWRGRNISKGSQIHHIALQRLRHSGIQYRPKNLSPEFVQYVSDLREIPPVLAYAP